MTNPKVSPEMVEALKEYFREVWNIQLEPHAWEEAIEAALAAQTSEAVGLPKQFLEPSALSAGAHETDPEYEADEDGNALWKGEVQSCGGHAIVAEVYAGSKAEAEARADAIAKLLNGTSPQPSEPVGWVFERKLEDKWVKRFSERKPDPDKEWFPVCNIQPLYTSPQPSSEVTYDDLLAAEQARLAAEMELERLKKENPSPDHRRAYLQELKDTIKPSDRGAVVVETPHEPDEGLVS